jgi:hypothetical protein
MAETTEISPEAGPPALDEARRWIGFELDDLDGGAVGRVHSLFVDAGSGEPAWLIAALERRGLLRRRAILVAIPVRDCAGGAGRVWTAHLRRELQEAPVVDPGRPLLREHEITICAHYGIGPEVGRAAEVVGRHEGAVTAQPAA